MLRLFTDSSGRQTSQCQAEAVSIHTDARYISLSGGLSTGPAVRVFHGGSRVRVKGVRLLTLVAQGFEKVFQRSRIRVGQEVTLISGDDESIHSLQLMFGCSVGECVFWSAGMRAVQH